MMKKDKLYTANKWNQPLFMDTNRAGNIFWPGGDLNSYGWTPNQMNAINSYPVANTAANYNLGTYQAPIFQTATISSIQPQIAAMKPVSAPTTSTKSGSTDWGGIAGTAAAAAPREAFDILDPVYHLAAGRETKVGNALSDTGVGLFKAGASSGNAGLMIAGAAAKIGGGLINAGWGVKENKKNIAAIKENTAQAKETGNALASSTTSSDFFNNSGQMVGSLGFGWKDLYKNGVFTSKGKKNGNALINENNQALAMQNQGMVTGANNVDSNLDDAVMENFYDLGGPVGFSPMTGALGIMQTDKYINAINNRTNAIARNNTLVNTSSSFSPLGNAFAEGGGIHIKPSHKGLFTEKANRAGMGVQAYASHVLANKEDYPSSTVRQANFAHNSKSWEKHAFGGYLQGEVYDLSEEEIRDLIAQGYEVEYV